MVLTFGDLGECYIGILCTVFATFLVSLQLFLSENLKIKRELFNFPPNITGGLTALCSVAYRGAKV